MRKKKPDAQPPKKKRRTRPDKEQDNEGDADDELVLEIVLDVTDTKKSFFWNHEAGADVVNLTRKVKRGAEVNWRQIDEEEKIRFNEDKAKEVDSFLTNEMLDM